MAKNRRRVEGEVTFSWIAARLVLFTLLVGFLLGITFLKQRNLKMGDELRALDRDLKAAQEKTSALEAQVARYKTPRELESKNARWRLGMIRPDESQIRRFRDPVLMTRKDLSPNMLVKADLVRTGLRNP
jgi:cell division protein FtsB